jgi:4-amino-4-deoxy-L-arabinose transferase-like glycosyltransferase
MQQRDDSVVTGTAAGHAGLRLSHALPVLGVALAIRLLVLWTAISRYPPKWFFTRGIEMGLLAHSLLAGQGLSSPFGGSTGPTAFIAPLYPILVAGVFRVFGEFSRASEICILSAQVLANLLTIWLIMRIARRLFNQLAATVAGVIWACSLPLVWMPTIFWETSISCCLLTGLVYLVLEYRALPTITLAVPIKLGAYCAIAGLLNPALLPSLLGISLCLFAVRREKTYALPVAALVFVLVFSPWPLRNAKVFHAFIPLRTTVGFELWMGNRPGATGFLDESLFPMFNKQELDDYKLRGEVAYSAHKSEMASGYIYAHPAEFLRLSAVRALRFWSGTGTQRGSLLFCIHAIFTTLAGFAGLFLLFRARRWFQAWLFALPFAIFPLPYLITHAEFRYRLVLDPLLTICSGYAIAELCALLGSRRRRIPSSARGSDSLHAARAT